MNIKLYYHLIATKTNFKKFMRIDLFKLYFRSILANLRINQINFQKFSGSIV